MPIPKPLCPHCHKAKCPHCWECGADLTREEHKSTCDDHEQDVNPLMMILPEIVCVACQDTGKNSRGGLCIPCINSGRI